VVYFYVVYRFKLAGNGVCDSKFRMQVSFFRIVAVLDFFFCYRIVNQLRPHMPHEKAHANVEPHISLLPGIQSQTQSPFDFCCSADLVVAGGTVEEKVSPRDCAANNLVVDLDIWLNGAAEDMTGSVDVNPRVTRSQGRFGIVQGTVFWAAGAASYQDGTAGDEEKSE
jgi:hypothetical protein